MKYYNMPLNAINYQNTIIYKLCCKNPEITDIYIGHTTNFVKRKQGHKQSCKDVNNNAYNTYKSIFIRNNGGFENWDMIEIEKFKCNDKYEAEKHERKYIDELKPTLNTLMPMNKYYASNEKEYAVKYKEEHYEKLQLYNQSYYEANKSRTEEQYKLYRAKNAEYIADYKKAYYQNHKDEINTKMKEELIKCDICQCEFRKQGLSRHLRTKLHLNNLKQISIEEDTIKI